MEKRRVSSMLVVTAVLFSTISDLLVLPTGLVDGAEEEMQEND